MKCVNLFKILINVCYAWKNVLMKKTKTIDNQP